MEKVLGALVDLAFLGAVSYAAHLGLLTPVVLATIFTGFGTARAMQGRKGQGPPPSTLIALVFALGTFLLPHKA